MTKKRYFASEMEVVKLTNHQPLMAGSPVVEIGSETIIPGTDDSRLLEDVLGLGGLDNTLFLQ